MKKIISIMLSLVMFAGMTVPSYAATLKERIEQQLGISVDDVHIPVATDIKVKKVGGTYQDSPVVISENDISTSKFGLQATIDMSVVRAAFAMCEQAVIDMGATDAEKNSMSVTGQFVVEIEYPATGFIVDSNAEPDTAMDGFTSVNNDHIAIFEETVPRVETDLGNGYKKLTITIDVKSGTGLNDLTGKLSNLMLTYEDNSTTQVGTYTIRGSISGYTEIWTSLGGEPNSGKIGKITYDFDQWDDKENDAQYRDPADDISATIIVERAGSTGLGGVTKRTLKIMDGDEVISSVVYNSGTTIELGKLPMPEKPGYIFAGYYYDKELTQPVTESIKLTNDTTIYVKWQDVILNTDDHFAYIIGYPVEDGREEVRPEQNITREEIATVFYRLLKDDVRDKLFATTNEFPDVSDERWSNKAISTMANGGYILGYEDDTFKPAKPITRAEFVTIAARFYTVDENVVTDDVEFTDVGGHWAEKYIKYATACGWIDGYEDNTFKPNKYITRAEVMKIINNMLGRKVNEEGLTEDAKRWVDNSADKWYYYEVIEATNFHSYERAEGAEAETWTAILENEILVDKPEYEDA